MSDFGRYGNAIIHDRYMEELPNKRRKCSCGCNFAATHKGIANGVCLTSGCELSIRRWVKHGFKVKK